MATAGAHPYYPLGAQLSGGVFTPNTWDVLSLILSFLAALAVLLVVTLAVVTKVNPNLKLSDQLLALWFVMTGSIHVFFEGYFFLNHGNIASKNDFFGQLWKEYALSDSRYLTSDPFLLVVEFLTITILGPLCLALPTLIATSSPWRHPIQALVSTGHIHSNLIYLSTSILLELTEQVAYSRPEPLYFWGYFIGCNGVWLVVPGYCLWSSIRETANTFKTARSPAATAASANRAAAKKNKNKNV